MVRTHSARSSPRARHSAAGRRPYAAGERSRWWGHGSAPIACSQPSASTTARSIIDKVETPRLPPLVTAALVFASLGTTPVGWRCRLALPFLPAGDGAPPFLPSGDGARMSPAAPEIEARHRYTRRLTVRSFATHYPEWRRCHRLSRMMTVRRWHPSLSLLRGSFVLAALLPPLHHPLCAEKESRPNRCGVFLLSSCYRIPERW
jgi:hypothetical protein